MSTQKIVPAALAAVILLSAGALVSAKHGEDEEDAKERAALQSAKVTLSEAIATAEKEVGGGKVVDAEVEIENGTPRYAIEIDKDGVQTVHVDLESGQVLKVAAGEQDDDAVAGATDDDNGDDEDDD